MKTPAAESFHRLGELSLLTTALVLPFAFHPYAYDPAALKFTILQWSSLIMLSAWLWQGVSRGRFQAPASSWTVLLPALAYGAWLLLLFAAEPHKAAALPDFLTRLTMLVAFLGAFLGFAGARSASRFAVLTVAAGWLVALQALLGGKGDAGDLLAAAVPLALTLDLDPETPAPLRVAALLLLPAAGAAVVLAGSAFGMAAFCATCLLYAAIVPAALRTRRALKSGGLALAAAAIVGAVLFLGRAELRLPAAGLGAAGVLRLWLFAAALWTGARGAAALRRAGALPESTYAAGFAAAAAGALAAALLGWASSAPGWYAWPLAGLAAGLAPLAARRAAVSVYPLPVSESVRRALYAPALLAFAALAVAPGLWLRSEVNLNSAVYLARHDKDVSKASAMFARVLPGSRGYTTSLFLHGEALAGAGRHEEALVLYDRLKAQAPGYALLHAARGAAYAKLGDWKAAAAERARQAELDPLDIGNLTAWAEAARASGNLEEARLAAGKAEALEPGDERVRLQLAANDLLERRLLAKAGRSKMSGRGVVKKPR